jgi:DNA-binding winged helix-turn-helix (wHTH) protein/WD40 repeat protein
MNPVRGTHQERYRFGQFEFDAASGRLWRNGLMVRLQWQPGRVLGILVAADGEVVSREELQKALWPEDSYGDFDTGLNTAIKKLRQALDDSAQNPRFVETLPRMGYRFLAPVTKVALPGQVAENDGEAAAGEMATSLPLLAVTQEPVAAGESVLASNEPESAAHATTTGTGRETASPEGLQRLSRWPRWAVAVAILLVLAVAVVAGRRWVIPGSPAEPGALRLSIALPPDQELPNNLRGRIVVLSPDGTEVYYVASASGTLQIFRRKLTGTTSERIPGTDGATALALSPDGRQLLFHRAGEAWLVSLDGLRARKVAPPDESWTVFPYFAFGPDGEMFVSGTIAGSAAAGEGVSGKGSDRATGGATVTPELPTQGIYSSRDGKTWELEMPAVASYAQRGGEYQFPLQVLPDGKLLWAAAWSPRERSIYLRDRQTGSNRLLAEPAMSGHITPDGVLLYYWQGDMRARRLNERQVDETPWTIAKDVMVAGWGVVHASASDNGNLVYVEGPPPPNVQLFRVAKDGSEAPIPAPARPYSLLDVSRDGERLLLGLSESSTTRSIWSYHLDSGEWVRLLDDAPEPPAGVWSPSGSYAVVNSYSGGLRFPNIMAVSADGKSPLRRLSPSPHAQFPLSWSSARAPLAFMRSEVKGTSIDVGLLFPQPGDKGVPADMPEPAPGVQWTASMFGWPNDQRHPAISPDGKWLAFTQGFLDGSMVQVCRLPDCTQAVTVPQSQGGQAPLWDETGQVLFFRLDKGVYATRIQGQVSNQPEFEAPVKLFEGNYTQPNFWNREMLYDTSSKRFLMARQMKPAESVRQIQVVLNWESLLEGSPREGRGGL